MWKPIESAPKDGTRILVKNSNLEYPIPHIAAFTYYSNCFINVWDTNLKLDNATHWHPIPTDDNVENVELLNWISLINNAVCLLPDVKNETVQALVDARNKVIK